MEEEEKLRRKVLKKRGRPPKTKRLEEEGVDATADITNASSTSLETESASLDEPMASKPRTRYALSGSDKKATPSSQSRIPVQNMNEHSSETETETLGLVKQILFEPNRVDKPNHVQVKAKDTHSDLESMSPGKIIEAPKSMTSPSKSVNQTPPRKNELGLGKSTSDLLARTPQPLQVASPSDKTLTKCNPPEMEANAVSNISPNLTVQTSENPAIKKVISEPEDPVIELEGYKVKKELAPLLKAIFKKYGDIARNSIFSTESRSCLLEIVCSIYKKLETSDFMHLTPLELDSMKGQVKDLEFVKVNIGWLHKRLDQISKAMDMDYNVSGTIDIVINEKKRAVKICEEELQKLKASLQQEKDELDALQICTVSLVHGLV